MSNLVLGLNRAALAFWVATPIAVDNGGTLRDSQGRENGDVYELRFDQSVAVLFALVGIADMCVKIGLMLKGAMVLIESGTGGIDTNVAIIALTIMFVASVTGMIISVFTKPVAKRKLDRFYGLVRTPVRQGEVIDRPCELPPGVAADARRMITTAFGSEIPVPSRASVIGFVAATPG